MNAAMARRALHMRTLRACLGHYAAGVHRDLRRPQCSRRPHQLLAQRHAIHAPELLGSTPGDPYAIHQVDDLWDAVLTYEQTLGASACPPRAPTIAEQVSFPATLAA